MVYLFSRCGIKETSISHQSELPVHNKMHKYASQNMLKILLERRTCVLYNRDINERKGEYAMKERTYIAIDLKSFTLLWNVWNEIWIRWR